MLVQFTLNTIDTFNIMYLWAMLSKKDNNIIKLLFSVVILSISCTIIEQFDLSFILVYIVGITELKLIYKNNLKDITVRYLLVLLIIMLLQLVLTLFVSRFTNDYFTQEFIIDLILMINIVIFSRTKDLKEYVILKYAEFENMNSNILIYFIFNFSIYVMFFKFIWNYYYNIIIYNLPIIIGIIITLVSSQFFVYVHIFKVIREKEKLKIYSEYNSAISEIVQEIKQRQHDFINYKNTIKGIVNVANKGDIKKAINKYMNGEDIYDDKINSLIYIENVVVRSVIYRNMCKFKKHNINFEYEIENNVLDDILGYNEISNVLNNLLNNAFEEVVKDECIEKNIGIKIFKTNEISHLIIKNQVVNSNNIDLNKMFTRGYSTKEKSTRGYGLHNVQFIVNSHKGHIKINIEDGEITFDIYFNNS